MNVVKRAALHLFLILLQICCMSFPLWGNVFKILHPVSVLPTEYFDIIFPEQCSYTACSIAENGDRLFEEACRVLNYDRRFRMPVVISPDSDMFSVSYTASPYNRIVIYEAVGQTPENSENIMLAAFYRELVRAVSTSVRSPFWQAVSQFFAVDALQPAYLLNLPFSFVEGACCSLDSNGGEGILNDGFSLQILSQSKLENRFPSWRQACGARDIYPGSELARAAGSAFAAYMQQRWGMEKYAEFWQECGRVHFFRLTAGIFKKVYGLSLKRAWNDFKDSVPLPSDIEAMNELEEFSSVIFNNNRGAVYKFPLSGPDCIIWYDDAGKEVCLLSSDNKKQRLFSASGVTNLAISPDGTYLAVSFYAEGVFDNLHINKVKIYDMEQRSFLRQDYNMRSGGFAVLEDGSLGVAGICTEGLISELQIYPVGDDKLLFSRCFPPDVIPFTPASCAAGKVMCLLSEYNERFLFSITLADGAERKWKLPRNVRSINAGEAAVTFTYVPDEKGALARMGYASLSENGAPEKLYLQTSDISGGIYDPVMHGSSIIYSAHKAERHELRSIPFSAVSFSEEDFEEIFESVPQFRPESVPTVEKKTAAVPGGRTKKTKFLGSYQLKGYNPFPYIFRGTWIPMLPVYSISFDGYNFAPGLGTAYLTQTDPLENISGVLSFCAGFATPESNYLSFNDDFTVAAYFKNSSLPVEITAGGIWSFDKKGRYNLKVLAGVKWAVPLGMDYHKLEFNAQQLWTCSTSYTDPESKKTSELSGWPSIEEAFNDMCYSLSAAYSNYRQAGISRYEQLGFETGITLLADYDFEKGNYSFNSNDDDDDEPTQIKFSIDLGLKLPGLIPLPAKNNWVLDFPLTVHSLWYGENGTSIDSYAEVLLVGREAQTGIPVLNLYVHRFGVKFGYGLLMKYDSTELPDIRRMDNFISVLKTSEADDFIYLTADGVFAPTVGLAASSLNINGEIQCRYYIRSGDIRTSVLFKINM